MVLSHFLHTLHIPDADNLNKALNCAELLVCICTEVNERQTVSESDKNSPFSYICASFTRSYVQFIA